MSKRPSLKSQLAAKLGVTNGKPTATEKPADETPFHAFHADADASETPADPWPAPLADEAMHGLAGEVVQTILPQTEADPVALLVQFLTAIGNVIGRTAHFTAEASKHFGNLFCVMVGSTSKGRKGTSWNQVGRLFSEAEQDWFQNRVLGGLSSGEGLIWSVRDPIVIQEPVKEKGHVVGYEDVMKDAGIGDKRAMVLESEFAAVLKVAGREGNTLSTTIRQAWDTGTLRTMTKNSPAKATEAHISIVGHVTKDELRRHLTSTEQTNGFGNRFLWICVQRSKALPDGGYLPHVALEPLIERLHRVIEFASKCGELQRDDESRKLWHEVYPELSEGKPGLLGGMLSRAEAQVMRLAMLYAVLDCSPAIRLEHLTAALALWTYCEESARFLFGAALGDRNADAILDALKRTAGGMTRNDIREVVFSKNIAAPELDRALTLLDDARLAHRRSEETGGRPRELWFAASRPT